MNYFPFHIGDYVSATRHLSWEEDCAFRRLLDTYYTTEAPLPLDPKKVCRLVMATTDAQREAVQTVLEEFFQRTDAGWINRRADAEIDAMRDKQQKQRDKANKRWNKPRPDAGTASALPEQDAEHAAASRDGANAMPPTPTPTPTPDIDTPAAPAAVAPRTSRRREDMVLKVYLEQCKAAGVKPVPDDHSVRAYCADAGITVEMLQVAWCVFRHDYTGGTNKLKRYKDWPGHFENAIRGCWARLWFTDNGEVKWSSRGLQEKAVLEARMKAKGEDVHAPA